MGFDKWARDSIEEIRENGMDGLNEVTYQLYLGFLRRAYALQDHSDEESIFDREWDILVILDACRRDLIESVEDDYDFLTENKPFRSMGSMSREWMQKNFTEAYSEELRRTAYISGNIFTEDYAEPNQFDYLDEVWKYAWEGGTVPARAITDRGIAVYRNEDPDRMILHYMQPHAPSVPDPLGEGMALPGDDDDWTSSPELLRAGAVTKDRLVESYRANLRYVLDDVAVLLENVDAEHVAITADHGEAFGEKHIYEHPDHMPLDILREVPWYETTATDQGTYEPSLEPTKETGDMDEKLRALGYL
ncbi:sulfatase-like hydrolase/transferase [Halolamina sediminis]|uniref:sulfatase-like hydrolase/transferase n=1 Tax=Halolamina sediminis TaxID=1480675 RepID=UPI0006B4CD36|nr:sulfatase-like hydrolase/transferase [Halolamina sediminis]